MNHPMRILLALCLALATLPAHAVLVLSYHDIRDDVAAKGDPDPYAVSTANFVAHLEWLRAHDYVPVSAQAVREARAGGPPLPDRAVLLTFDDGLRSVYTHVFPLLRAYGYPALVAPVTAWTGLGPDDTVDYGPRPFLRDDFATWAQLREMQASGLVEIASHSHDLHRGVAANPQGNRTPAAVTRLWSPSGYESEAAYRARVQADLAASAAAIERGTGVRPRTIVWPYAAYNRVANEIAAAQGMTLSFDLEGRALEDDLGHEGRAATDDASLARLLLFDNPDVADLAMELRRDPGRTNGLRAMQVDLDYVYDPDPAQAERNLDVLVQRVRDIGPGHVFLQAFADPDGDGAADAVYFPNRHLPVRADLFNRVAWQLRTRAGVRVFAWLPVLGWTLPDAAVQSQLQLAAGDPADVPRLDPSDPRSLAVVEALYADLAVGSYFEGLLFHDDAYLRDGEAAGLGNDPAARTRALVDFTHALTAAAERWRPKLTTVRNLFARPVLEPASEAWFAQRLDAFNAAYDYTALMAMPRMEGERDAAAWLRRLVDTVAAHPHGLERTIFELQTVDWRTRQPVPEDELAAQARLLVARGARHLAYYPDDFLRASPALPTAREVISAREFPYIER